MLQAVTSYADMLAIGAMTRDEQEHLERIRRRWDIYYGRHPRSLKVRPGGFDDNVVVNYSRNLVDTSVAYLFGDDVEFQLDKDAESPDEEWLDAALGANRRVTLFQLMAINGAVAGHSFVKLMPPDPGLTGHEYPRIIVLDPESVTPRWDEDDISIVTRYRIQYNTLDYSQRPPQPVVKRQIIERNEAGRWTIVDQIARSQNSDWVTVSEAVWPWDWSPVLDCQNLPRPNEFWGCSDLEDDTLATQHSINFLASNMLKIIRNHAHPKPWAKGVAANSPVDLSPDTMVLLGPDGALGNLEMTGDLSSSLSYLQWLVQQFVSIDRTPEIALGLSDEPGNLSGVALQMKFAPLLQKTAQKRHLYGEMLAELCRRLLDMGGKQARRPELTWPDVLPQDPLMERQAAVIDQQLGASKETLLVRFGYDPEVEKQRREEEQKAQENVGAALLQSFMRGGRPNDQTLRPGTAAGGSNAGATGGARGSETPT